MPPESHSLVVLLGGCVDQAGEHGALYRTGNKREGGAVGVLLFWWSVFVVRDG